MKKFFSRYILSFDLIFSTVMTVIFSMIFANKHNEKLLLIISEKLSDVGITVFSVIFPLFFAAFSIIIASSDDKFSKFLQGKGYYQEIIKTFKFTLLVVFIAFIYSILLYSTINVIYDYLSQKYFFILVISYFFIFLYSLFASFNSIMDSIRYAQRRGAFYLNNKQ